MSDHFAFLQWWEPVALLSDPGRLQANAKGLVSKGVELVEASLGSRNLNLHRAIAGYEAALRVYTEQEFPRDWAGTQNNLGIAWSDLPISDRSENLRRAIGYYEAALRVYTVRDFPQDWAMMQNNLGVAWNDMAVGGRSENLLISSQVSRHMR